MIVDQNGRLLKMATIAEPQTAKITGLQQQFAGHPSRGLTPVKLARILEDAEQGNITAQHELFMDMEEKDTHIFAEMSKRKRAILKLDWDVVAPRNASRAEQDAAAYARELIQDMADFEDMLLDLLDAVGHGFAALELQWQLLGKEWVITRAEHRPQTWFQPNQERTAMRLRDNSLWGQELNPFGWILHTHRAKSGYLSRSGLHRVLVWPYLFKNYSVRDLAEFLEIYGLPLRLGKYPAGATEDEKLTLLRAVTQIGHNAAGIIPEGMMVDFESASSGTHEPFMAMTDWCEKSESKAILGGTLTSQADGKSSTNALGKVHNEVRHDLLESDARQLSGSLTRDLIYPLLALNGRAVDNLRRCPRLVFDTEEGEDMKLYAQSLPGLVKIGVKVPANWARDKLRIPKPKDGEEVLSMSPAAKGDKSPARVALAALSEQLDKTFPDQDAIDHAVDQPKADLTALTKPLLEPLIAALTTSNSFEEALNQLAEVYPSMEIDALADVLARAEFVGHLWGKVNASA